MCIKQCSYPFRSYKQLCPALYKCHTLVAYLMIYICGDSVWHLYWMISSHVHRVTLISISILKAMGFSMPPWMTPAIPCTIVIYLMINLQRFTMSFRLNDIHTYALSDSHIHFDPDNNGVSRPPWLTPSIPCSTPYEATSSFGTGWSASPCGSAPRRSWKLRWPWTPPARKRASISNHTRPRESEQSHVSDITWWKVGGLPYWSPGLHNDGQEKCVTITFYDSCLSLNYSPWKILLLVQMCKFQTPIRDWCLECSGKHLSL